MQLLIAKYTMKKHLIFLFISLFVLCGLAQANVITGQAAIPDGYYSGVDGKSSADAILDALFAKIKDHTVIAYGALEDYYEQTDFYSDTVWDMYSTCRFTMADANGGQNTVCDAWNKEHSIPQSWFNKASPMKSDLFHVYPTDARVNNFRSNLPYGEVAGGNGAGFPDNYQNHGLGKKGSNTFSGYTGTVFEPADDYKGDFARTYFYMVARYRDKALNGSEGSKVFTSNKTNLTTFAKNLFLKWHRQDPVSQKEIDRNQAVYGIQHNRNPFIDYPELAEYIWGNKAGQTVVLSSMTPTCEGGVVPPPDPTPVTKYGVTWSVNGEEMHTDSVQENQQPASLPDEPTSCSEESPVFLGWTTTPIAGSQDDAPAVLYKALSDFPAVTADQTYYAVFARENIEQGTAPAVYTYSSSSTAGWTNNAFKNNSYWILRTGLYLESPSIDLSGLTSITMHMRTYGGASYNTVKVMANGSQIATLVAAGSSLADQTWTKSSSLSGMSTLRFESETSTSSHGPAFDMVTINATGTGVTYDRYITSCGGAKEAIQTSVTMPRATKIFRNGQIFIEINNKLYNITGQQIY